MQFSIPFYLSIVMRIIASRKCRTADQGTVERRPFCSTASHLRSYSISSPQLQNHVNGRPSNNVIAFQRFIVCQLLSTVDEFNLVHLNAFLFL